MTMADTSAFVGALLSVTTKAQLRYEGIVMSINQDDRTLSLKDVVCYGSEHRKTTRFVPRSDKNYHWIIFNASDIEDLQVLRHQHNGRNSGNDGSFVDPAIIQAQASSGGIMRPFKTRNTAMDTKNAILAELNPDQVRQECKEDFNFQENNEAFNKDQTRDEFHKSVELSRATGFHQSSLNVRNGYNPTSSFYDDISSGPQYKRQQNNVYGNNGQSYGNNGSNGYGNHSMGSNMHHNSMPFKSMHGQ